LWEVLATKIHFFRRKLALYDYDPTQLSPNVDSEVELSFRAGDILLVFGDMVSIL
jgi:RIMS-binding protein 2